MIQIFFLFIAFFPVCLIAQIEIDTLYINLEEDKIIAVVTNDFLEQVRNGEDDEKVELYSDFMYYLNRMNRNKPGLVDLYITDDVYINENRVEIKCNDLMYVLVRNGNYYHARIIVDKVILQEYEKLENK